MNNKQQKFKKYDPYLVLKGDKKLIDELVKEYKTSRGKYTYDGDYMYVVDKEKHRIIIYTFGIEYNHYFGEVSIN